jgi:hypothetical protein
MPNELPYVSVCTPTFNRRPFFESTIRCFDQQIYPKHRMEWIIIDDGTDKIEDLVSGHPNVKYFKSNDKMTLGKKRNLMHAHSCGDIIVYMDDDDYYPPERVSHAVEALMAHPGILCAGSSEIYIYFKHLNSMMQFGPYAPNHATAGTFAFRREMLTQTRYDDFACLAEERFFLKDYTIPMIQLDPTKVILVFSHIHNTFDKRKLLLNANPAFVKPTTKTIDDFICGTNRPFFKDFFLNRMDALLQAYAPGNPEMKPDVISQTKELEQNLARIHEQEKQQQQQQQQGGVPSNVPVILMHQEGKEPVALTNDQVLSIIQTQQTEIKTLTARVATLESEKVKDDSMLQNLISCYIDATVDGTGVSNEALVRQCLKDATDRDDKLKKTKALYIKSINETATLKKTITDLRAQIQSIQSAAVLQQTSTTSTTSTPTTPTSTTESVSASASNPIRLVIDE